MSVLEPLSESPRQYGELYYHSSVVSALLQAVAGLLEGDKRRAVLNLSCDLPTTMPWLGPGQDLQQQADKLCLCRVVQFGLRYDPVFGTDTLRLACLLRNGTGPECLPDREYVAGMVDRLSDTA